jgi:hypothetical protein
MTPSEILGGLRLIEDRIKEKGYYNPNACIRVNWVGYDLTLAIESSVEAGNGFKTEYIHTPIDDGFEALFVRADAYVNGMKSIVDAKKEAFVAAIGRLIDQGRAIGIEVEYMNPLTEMMGKLSTNIITKA